MKIIDKNNIEECLFDYFEGNLTDSEKIQLTDFLNKHPEFQTDYEAWKRSYVVEAPMVYPNADKLLVKGNFNKKIFWFLGIVSVGIITSLFLMFGDFYSEIQPVATADLIQKEGFPVENKIVKEEKPFVKENETPINSSPGKKENAMPTFNQSDENKQASAKKEIAEKYFSHIAEQPKTQPVQSKKTVQEIKTQEELPTEIPPASVHAPAITENSSPEKSIPVPEISQEQLNDSATTTNQPEETKIDSSANDNKEKKKRNFKWIIKVIPVENVGL